MNSRIGQILLRNSRAYSTVPIPNPIESSLRIALKASMKARNSFRSGVIKGILSDLLNATKLAGPPPAEAKTLARAITARIDAAVIFRAANPPREDLAVGNEEEVSILKEFAPAEVEGMSTAALDEIVDGVLKELGLVGAVAGKDSGKVIKAVLQRVGELADGKAVSAAVKSRM